MLQPIWVQRENPPPPPGKIGEEQFNKRSPRARTTDGVQVSRENLRVVVCKGRWCRYLSTDTISFGLQAMHRVVLHGQRVEGIDQNIFLCTKHTLHKCSCDCRVGTHFKHLTLQTQSHMNSLSVLHTLNVCHGFAV